MKKLVKTILAGLMAATMLTSLVGCKGINITLNGFGSNKSEQKEINYQTMIDSFVSSPLNTFELTIGDAHAPNAAIWLKNQAANGTAYTSDDKVVTVTELGKVTAVGEGSAYVVITAQNGAMFEVYRYDVYAAAPEADLSNLPQIDGVDLENEINNFNSTKLNTYNLKIGNSHTPTAAVWTNTGASCYTTDAKVVEIAANGNVTAKGRGTAYVVIKSSIGNMYEIYKYVVNG